MVKKIIFQLHLWLGLLSGIIVFIVSVTGCLYVFHEEITTWLRKDAIYADKDTGTKRLPQEKLLQAAQQAFPPGETISWFNIYNNPEKNQVFFSYKNNPDGLTYFTNIDHYNAVFVNPYSGKIEGVYNEKTDFFNVVKFLHWSLLFKTSIGQPIVGWATLIFVVLLITGLVLWWPKSFKSARNLFRIKWKKTTGIYKKFYDLHNVLGFWGLAGLLIISLTGMVWAFGWFQGLVYVAASGTTTPPERLRAESDLQALQIEQPLNEAFHESLKLHDDAAAFRFTLPQDSAGIINVYVQQKEGLYYQSHQLQFDRYTGELLAKRNHEEKNAGEKLITANYDIHTGAILGMPGKILAFILSLIAASLPVTGFMMWWKRTKKRKKSLF